MGNVVSIDAFRRLREAQQAATAAEREVGRPSRGRGALPEGAAESVFTELQATTNVRLGSAEREDSKLGLIPIELGTGIDDRREALDKIAEYQLRAIDVRMISDQPMGLLYLMSIKDAITLNMNMLEHEDLSNEQIGIRIDLIQLLENTDPALVDSLWESFTRGAQTSDPQSEHSERL